MPIRVDYTPVGALAKLAQQAGANLAKQTTFMNALRMKQLSEDIWARKRAQDMQFIQLSQSNQARLNAQRIQQEQFGTTAGQFDRSLQYRYDALTSGQALTRETRALEAGQKERAFEIQEATGLRRAQKEEFDQRLKMMEFATPEQKMARELELYGGKKGVEIAAARTKEINIAELRKIAKQQGKEERLTTLLKLKETRPQLDVQASLYSPSGALVDIKVPKRPKTTPEIASLKRQLGFWSREARTRHSKLRSYQQVWGTDPTNKQGNVLGLEYGEAAGIVQSLEKDLFKAEQTEYKKYPTLAGGGSVQRGPVAAQGRPAGIPVGENQAPSREIISAAMQVAGPNNESAVAELLQTWGYDPSKIGK